MGQRFSSSAALALCTALILTSVPAIAAGGGPVGWGPSSGSEAQPQGPTSTSTYRKAVRLLKKEKYEDAIAKLNELVKDSPNDPDVLNYLGFAHRKLGKNAEALNYYQRALAANPEHKGANEYLGELYLQMGDLPKAEVQAQKLKMLCPTGCEEREDLDNAIVTFKTKPAG